ncbi:hypothetical protein [Sphingobium cloacae]|uniref:Uncharacterized protein n=1 Tax=Sphingobium cloacae TaxID=120107 RepID=A0A1E1F351_9SPHN|nr:hypothetical protein [Sphingobium cloacae]BAV64953.1 hypothetical protein SCLO_1019130 [Sphingobium cloacae]
MAGGFWIAGGGAIGAAVLLGMGLGHFAATPPGSPALAEAQASELPDTLDSPLAAETEKGPEVIRCTGCGPTLAERQMRADQGAWDPDGMIHGSSDPVVQDYMASDDAAVPPVQTPPSPARRLARAAERFAAGEEPSPAASPESLPVRVRPTLAPAVAGQP